MKSGVNYIGKFRCVKDYPNMEGALYKIIEGNILSIYTSIIDDVNMESNSYIYYIDDKWIMTSIIDKTKLNKYFISIEDFRNDKINLLLS